MTEDKIKILKKSKPIADIKEGDSIFINEKEMKVDKHYLLQDHENTKEMIIEIFNPINDREYQVRYFDDQIDESIEVYELQNEFQYIRREPKSISW